MEFNAAFYGRPKVYVLVNGGKVKAKAKGIPKSEIKKIQNQLIDMIKGKEVVKLVYEGKRVPTLWKQLKLKDIREYENTRKILCLLFDKRRLVNEIETEPWHIDDVKDLKVIPRVYHRKKKIHKVTAIVNGEEVKNIDEYLELINNKIKKKEVNKNE